jgi:hypothetical protein
MDWSAVLAAAVLPMLWWVVAAGGATLAGYPGVICVTPLGWLLGLSAGPRLLSLTKTRLPSRLRLEAFLAGALIGLFQGLLAALVMTFASPLGPTNPADLSAIVAMLLVFLIGGGIGAVACGAAAFGMGEILIRKTARAGQSH